MFLEIFSVFPILAAAFFSGAAAKPAAFISAAAARTKNFNTAPLNSDMYAQKPISAKTAANTCTAPSPGPIPKANTAMAAAAAYSTSSTAPHAGPEKRRRARTASYISPSAAPSASARPS